MVKKETVSVPAKAPSNANETLKPDVTAKPRSHWVLVACIAMLLVGLAPAIRMAWHIAATGANAISTDYIYIVPLIDQMLDGSYQWQNLLKDTFILQHICPLAILTHLANAVLFEFDNRADLWVGFVLTLASAGFFASSLIGSAKKESDAGVPPVSLWQKFGVLTAVLLLSFGTTRASALLYGEPAIALGLTTFGFSLGAWGLMKFPQKLAGSLLMLLGGLVSSFAWGMAPPCWLSYLVLLIVQRTRSIRDYAMWALGVVLCFFPYFGFLPVSPSSVASGQTKVWFPDVVLVLNNLGRTFANELATRFDSLPTSLAAGSAGLIFLGALLVAMKKAKVDLKVMPAVAAMCVYGLSTCAFLALFRNVSMPWYIPLTSVFWYGLIGMAIGLAAVSTRTLRLVTIASLVSVTGLYLWSNIGYQDKNVFEMIRSPASESCLRHFETAPTYMELSACTWGLLGPDVLRTLAEPMRRHGLSAFSSNQQWSLQGDYALPVVSVPAGSDYTGINWIKDRNELRPGKWDEPEHLNLYLSPGNSIQWKLNIPGNAVSANLSTSVAWPQSKEKGAKRASISLASIGLNTSEGAERQVRKLSDEWQNCKIDLSKFRGKEVVVTFATPPNTDAVFAYPTVDVRVDKSKRIQIGSVERQPCNTDLSPSLPKTGQEDLTFDPNDRAVWKSIALKEFQNGWESSPAHPGALVYCRDLDVPLRDFGYFYSRTSFTEDIKPPRALHVGFILKSGKSVRFPIILLSDGKMHSYTYDLKLLQLGREDRIVGIQLYPQTLSVNPGQSKVVIEEVRLIKLPERSGAQAQTVDAS